MNDITKVNLKHTMRLSAEEVITKLKRRMAQHDTGIRQTFLKYSKSGKGRVTRKDLKHVSLPALFVDIVNLFAPRDF